MTVFIAPIVEGHSEVVALPALLHRIWNELLGWPCRLHVLDPARKHRDDVLKVTSDTLEKAVNAAFVQARMLARQDRDPASLGVVLLLVDAEGACPAQLAPGLLGRGQQARKDARVTCVLPNRMFENWITAGAAGLAGLRLSEECVLPATIQPPPDPEAVGGKRWISQLLLDEAKHTYSETGDSVELVRAMDLAAARASSPSFDKLCRELAKLIPPPPPETPPADPPPAG